jgi:RND superfamily putative drug exporter
MAAVAIPACFLAIYGLAEITTVSVIVQYLAALIGLGVAIDYSLLLVTRRREELAAGHDTEQAVGRAMATAGRSVAFSGVTVAVGLLSLIVLPVPALRSIGLGGMIVPAVSVASPYRCEVTARLHQVRLRFASSHLAATGPTLTSEPWSRP